MTESKFLRSPRSVAVLGVSFSGGQVCPLFFPLFSFLLTIRSFLLFLLLPIPNLSSRKVELMKAQSV